MAISYSIATKNARLQAVIDSIGVGGLLVVGTDALAGATGVLVEIPLSNQAFSAPVNGSMSLAGTPISTASHAMGTAAKAEIRTSTGTTIVSGFTVGGDIIITPTNIEIGSIVTVSAGTITHA